MGKSRLRLTFTISCLCLLWISCVATLPSRYSLGIDPKDASYYSSNVIECKDRSKKFAREQLNDDFCDCPDGTDEPGTSACPEGKFFCLNAGHIPLSIFSSRVNDGLCDCCDGSDEYDGSVKCPNTCWEAGKAARDKLNKKIKTYQEGVTVRRKEIEKAKQAFAKDEEDLSKLKSEEKILKDLVDKLKDHKERIEKEEKRLNEAAEEERLKKEKEEKRLKEAEEKAKEQDRLSDKVPHDPTDGILEGSAKQDVSKVDHATTAEDKEDHVETELSADTVEQPAADEDDIDDTYKPETADHSENDKEVPSDAANQNLAKEQDDTLRKDGNDDKIGNDEADSSHITKKQGDSDDTSGPSKEELGRLVASRWTGENVADKTDDTGSTMKDGLHEAIPDSGEEEDDSGYASETDDDRHKYDDDTYKYDDDNTHKYDDDNTHKYDDDDFEDDADEEYADDHVEPDASYAPGDDDNNDLSDLTDSSSSSWLDKIKQTVHNVLSSFNFFKSPVDLSEADRVRKEYEDSKSKLSKIQSRISSLTEKLKHDFGKQKEFYSFYDRCFENKQSKYVYKVCPFKQASQIEGHSTTRLGNWEKFDESYRIMQFSSGEKCWNGPDRSLKVRLRCGLTNELTDVDEPSRCEYVAMLSTPVLCAEDKLKELEQRLERMNTGQPVTHDEL